MKQSKQNLSMNTENVIKSWQQNEENFISKFNTVHKSEHLRIINILEKMLSQHLSWSLDKVCVRGFELASISDTKMVIPDIWIETISSNPVSAKQVVETNLVIAVIDYIPEKDKQESLKQCFSIESLQELILISINELSVEVFRRSQNVWIPEKYYGDSTIPLEAINLTINMNEIISDKSTKATEVIQNNKPQRECIVVGTGSPAKIMPNTRVEMQLPYRPDIYPMESGRGYLIRVADELGYKTPNKLLNVISTNLKEINQENNLINLSHLLRQQFDSFNSHFYLNEWSGSTWSFLGNNIPFLKCYVNLNHPRICPKCLSESHICNALWDLKLVTVCPIHTCELIDTCPKCKNNLNWNRPSVDKCICGAKLSDIPTQEPETEVLALTELIYRALVPNFSHITKAKDAKYNDQLFSLPLGNLLKIISFFGEKFHPKQEYGHQIFAKKIDRKATQRIVKTASEVLSNWPLNYMKRINSSHRSDYFTSEVSKLLMQSLGNHVVNVYSNLDDPIYEFVQDALDNYVESELSELLIKINKNISTDMRNIKERRIHLNDKDEINTA